MKKLIFLSILSLLWLSSCSDEFGVDGDGISNSSPGLAESSFDSSTSLSGGGGSSSGGSVVPTGGLITAGEWNDLENWDFWINLLETSEHREMEEVWTIDPSRRIAVELIGLNEVPVRDAQIKLMNGAELIWEAQTDKEGSAELFIDPYSLTSSYNLSELNLTINDDISKNNLLAVNEGVNTYNLNVLGNTNSRGAEISFIVDATGSMGDELEFLKDELYDVINRVQSDHSDKLILTSSVFYRDETDEYVTKTSDWSADVAHTVNFIKEQSAGGGGDFPEAVHSALDEAINKLVWSKTSTTKISFLLLDAPPHGEEQVLDNLRSSITNAAAQGIKIIPIVASGIDKQTEFLMRFMSVLTNGTYVFITDDSGIGNAHLEPTVGDYEVEFLNDLMVRLISEYM